MPIRPGTPTFQAELKDSPEPLIVEYSDDYKESCFLAWYAAGRPRGKTLVPVLPPDEAHHNRKPHLYVFHQWIRKYGWQERADKMDAEVRYRLQEQAIANKVQMYQRHAEIAQQIIERGIEYLERNEPDTTAVALKMIKDGTEIERISTGGAQALAEVARKSDKALLQLISQLNLKNEDEDALPSLEDGEVDEEDVVDTV